MWIELEPILTYKTWLLVFNFCDFSFNVRPLNQWWCDTCGEKDHKSLGDFSDFLQHIVTRLQPFFNQALYFWENLTFIHVKKKLNQ